MDEERVQISSPRIRATLARSRAATLCSDARSLRKSSESVTASILSHLHASSFPGNLDPQRLVLRLVPLAPCVSFARRELGLWLVRNGVERSLASDISVACSEACANAVEHPVSPARHLFEVWGDAGADTVAIGVRDYGDWAMRPPDDRERGRGLTLIRALMDRVEVEREGAGTSVTMWKRRSPAQQSPSTTTST